MYPLLLSPLFRTASSFSSLGFTRCVGISLHLSIFVAVEVDLYRRSPWPSIQKEKTTLSRRSSRCACIRLQLSVRWYSYDVSQNDLRKKRGERGLVFLLVGVAGLVKKKGACVAAAISCCLGSAPLVAE